MRRIIELCHGQTTADTAEQAAAQLVGDPLVWLALLDRPQEPTRRAAAKQLAALTGEPIGIDPAADPATQKAQREKLRVKLEAGQDRDQAGGQVVNEAATRGRPRRYAKA